MKGDFTMPIKPNRLQKGDTVGVIAPASPPNPENLKKSLHFLEELGLKVKIGQHVESLNGYLAGSDEERLQDVHDMFLDHEIKAIFCACGGYGTGRIAAGIDFTIIKENPKIFWGYSDITFLHNAINQQTGLVTFHGPMLSSDIGKEDADPLTKRLFSQLFVPGEFTYTEDISPLTSMISGKARGQLAGGNLTLLCSTLGTPYELDVKGKILLIEDINEEPRNVDRMLNQLLMSGKLREAAGIAVGDFNQCEPDREQSLTLDEVIDHYIALANVPAIKGFKIGHCSPNVSVPLGAYAVIDADEKKLAIESGVL
ncbi:LD-carboxypeptidase [Actinomycetes bacterium NPDC127524]